MFEYLLKNGANINIQGGIDYNSALHEAVLVQDPKIIETLFKFTNYDRLQNIHRKMAGDLCKGGS